VDFIARFPEELPFVWEIIPLNAWISAIGSFLSQCARLPTTVKDMVIANHIETRSDMICSASPGMVSALRIARTIAEVEGDLSDLHGKVKKLSPSNREKLFDGSECDYQKLLQRHIDDVWPTFVFDKELQLILGSSFKDLLRIEKVEVYKSNKAIKYRTSVVNAPIILAASASRLFNFNWKIEPDLVSKIRQVRDFDVEWFNAAFSRSLIRCLAMRKSLDGLKSQEMQQ
jgi:hypothetical protein